MDRKNLSEKCSFCSIRAELCVLGVGCYTWLCAPPPCHFPCLPIPAYPGKSCVTGSRGTENLRQRPTPTGVAVSRAAGSPVLPATESRRRGGRKQWSEGRGWSLPPKAGLKLGLPERGSICFPSFLKQLYDNAWQQKYTDVKLEVHVCAWVCTSVCVCLDHVKIFLDTMFWNYNSKHQEKNLPRPFWSVSSRIMAKTEGRTWQPSSRSTSSTGKVRLKEVQ